MTRRSELLIDDLKHRGEAAKTTFERHELAAIDVE